MGKLLLEKEVAERLGCSATQVKYLRVSGRLPFIRGRPVLIDEDDLDAFLAAKTTKLPPEPGTPEHDEQRRAAAKLRARRIWLARKLQKRPT